MLYARELGIIDFGAFFIVIGFTSLLGRPMLGRLSDKIGRDLSVGAGFGLQLASLILITLVSDLIGMIVCGTFYMLGNALRQFDGARAGGRARRSAASQQQMAGSTSPSPIR